MVAFTGMASRTGSGQPAHPASMAAASHRADSRSLYSGKGANSPHPRGPRTSTASRAVTPLNFTRIGICTTDKASSSSARGGKAEVTMITSPVTWGEHAELVALGVGQDDPADLVDVLPDISPRRPSGQERLDHCVLVVVQLWREVQVKAVLDGLVLGDGAEDQAGTDLVPGRGTNRVSS